MDETASPYPDYIARCERGAVTSSWLAKDLESLGVRPGMLLMVHCSLSQLGYLPCGPEGLHTALRAAVGRAGTLVMPTFSSGNTDPQFWRNPPVPEAWWPVVRAELPAYDPHTSSTREMGQLAEYFRQLPDVRRSSHPAVSWAAAGPLADAVLAGHSLSLGLGDESPLGRCYSHDAWVLSLGTLRTTILHLAEYRAEWPGKEVMPQGSAMLVDGQREWVEYEDLDGFDEDFEELRQEYMALHADAAAPFEWRAAAVGYGRARLFRVSPLVDFAVRWIAEHRDWSEK